MSDETKNKYGIKHPLFTADKENGQSHRKNAARKKAQHIKNIAARAETNQRRRSMGAGEYHTMLAAISNGNI